MPAQQDFDDDAWDDLLNYIEERRVIPIIGPDLLRVQTDRGLRPLYEWLAEKLAGLVDNGRTPSPHERLSDREFEVLRALGSGMAVKDVAEQLHLSAKTVSTYRARLLEKMGLKSRADLVRYVVEHELLR